jgi:hypothetical protein
MIWTDVDNFVWLNQGTQRIKKNEGRKGKEAVKKEKDSLIVTRTNVQK